MTIYFTIFLFSLLFTYLASLFHKKRSFLFYFFSLIAIGVPVLLSSFRDPTVGTDSQSYIVMFEKAVFNSRSFIDYIYSAPSVELGFLVLNFACAQLVDNYVFYFIIIYSLILVPFYVGAFKLSYWINPVAAMAIFYLLFYNESLNLLRQYLSMAFLFLAIAYILQNKKKMFLMWSVIAFSIHTTAIFAFLIYFLYILSGRLPFKKYAPAYLFLFIAIVLLMMSFNSIGLLTASSEQEERIQDYMSGSEGGISSSTLIVYLFITINLMIKSFNYKNRIIDYLLLLSIMALILNFGSLVTHTLYRLSLIFSMACCISIPFITTKNSPEKKVGKYPFLANISMYMLFVAYWYFSVILRGSNETYPYTSILLGIQ